jgi:hypothetical protein
MFPEIKPCFRIRGPASVTDLGLRYLLGLNETAQDTDLGRKPGCLLLEVKYIEIIAKILNFVNILVIYYFSQLCYFKEC